MRCFPLWYQQFEEKDIKMLQDNLISQSICLIKSKEKHVKFLQDEINFQRIERQLKCDSSTKD